VARRVAKTLLREIETAIVKMVAEGMMIGCEGQEQWNSLQDCVNSIVQRTGTGRSRSLLPLI
jgi:hypothetical protein